MSSKRIRYLLKIMEENDLDEIELEEPEFKIKLRKKETTGPALVSAHPLPAASGPQLAPSSQPVESGNAQAEPQGDYLEIKSPMVGTFYRSSSPENDFLINEGDQVTDESVVCIIEAMKVMNEIKAGFSGKIVEVMVENAQPVEYGQVLFRVSVG